MCPYFWAVLTFVEVVIHNQQCHAWYIGWALFVAFGTKCYRSNVILGDNFDGLIFSVAI